jgi:hypothetical protein
MVATRHAVDSANRSTFFELERERRRRTWLILIGILLTLAGWRLAVRLPAGQYGLGSFPNIIEYEGTDYSYGSGWATDPPAECAVRANVPAELRQVGRITDVISDETASLGHVRPGDGAPVFGAVARRHGWLFAYSSPGRYVGYQMMP